MKRFLTAIVILLTLICVRAEENDRQVLVFGKDGVATLMYADELESINLSTTDVSGVEHSDFVSQEFIKKDGTVFRIALADIDSVAFGNRNKIVPKQGVHEIIEADIPFISSVIDNKITFKSSIPTSRIPATGQYVYYIGFNDLFPWGLCAKVESVSRNGDSSVCVSTIDVPVAEVFDEFFFSGDVGSKPALMTSRSDSRAGSGYPWSDMLNLYDRSEFKLLMDAELNFTKVVANVVTGYYHANIDFNAQIGLNFRLHLEDKKEYGDESTPATLRLPPLAWGAIQPMIEVGGFWEANAALGIDYEMTRSFVYSTEWTRKNGVNTFTDPNPTDNPESVDPVNDEAKIAIVLDGNLFGGFYSKLSVNTLFDHVGAGVRLRAGAELSGSLSFGALAELSGDHTKPLVDGSVDLSMKLDAVPYWYAYSIFSPPANKEEHTIGEPASLKFLIGRLNLFPNFSHSNAVPAQKQLRPFESSKKVCTAASISNEPIPYPLETGFELVNTTSDEVVDSVFTTTIEAFSLDPQGVSADLDFATSGKISIDEWQVRPIFRYGDYVLAAEPISLNEGARLSPFIFTASRAGTSLTSSFPAVGSYKADNRVFEWCGTPHVRKINPAFIPLFPDHGTSVEKSILKGTWKSFEPDESITLTFNDNENGHVDLPSCSHDFTYTLSATGEIRMKISEDNITRLCVISIDGSDLITYLKNKNNIFKFKKL